MEHQFVNYCLDCEWIESTDRHTRTELSRLAIDHACSTGHDLEGKRYRGDRNDADRPPD